MNTMPARLAADGSGPVVVIGTGRPDEVRFPLRGYDAAASYVGREGARQELRDAVQRNAGDEEIERLIKSTQRSQVY